MFDSMRIRTKLAVALVIPLLALGALASVAISASNRKADEAAARARAIDDQVDLAAASLGPSGVIAAVQAERNSEARQLIGISGAAALREGQTPESVRAATDVAIAQFEQAIAGRSVAVQEAYQPAIAAIDSIADLRGTADAYPGPRNGEEGATVSAQVFDRYTEVAASVFDGNSRVALAIDDPDLRAGATYIDELSRYHEAQTLLIAEVANAAALGGLTADLDAYAVAAGLDREVRALQRDMELNSSPFYRDLTTTTLADRDLNPSAQLVEAALAGEQVAASDFVGGNKEKGAGAYGTTLQAAADHLQSDAAALTAETDQEQADAESRARSVTIATGVVLLLAVGVTLLASRSITRPLARLVHDAEDMATIRLPNAVQDILEAPLGEDVTRPELADVDDSGGYEIAEVAAALNTVQQSAADLAIEQAVLRRNIADSFVNLGRRNQNLLSRQLDSITEMEREESDPEELEKLFVIDHLATRMRRNAESLLLLAGLEPHRQWSAPVPIVDVLRGALGEVEDYDRVVIDELDPATISGTAAADLTHMVAELLENALHYSPPGRDVEIIGRSSDTGYVLAIVDNGIGMSADDLAQANVRLAGDESFTVAPSRYLGHYVVGRQAARLGVAVTLHPTPTGGVTAAVELVSVLADEARQPVDEPRFDARSLLPDRLVGDEDTTPPATLAESLGTPLDADGPVASPERAPVAAASDRPTTASGYTRRVRGANTPNTDVLSARGGNDPSSDDAGDAHSTRSALSGLQAGIRRGRAERPTDDTEERR